MGESAEKFVVPRGAIVCPGCHGPMIRRDVDPSGVPASDGTIVRHRAYRCLTCGIYVKTVETSEGETAKGWIR